MTSNSNINRVRQLVSAAANAIAEENEDFDDIVAITRRSFRPGPLPLIPRIRGRRRALKFTKKTFLLRRANSDYFPIKSECEFLATIGLGMYLKIKNCICSQFAQINGNTVQSSPDKTVYVCTPT